MKLFLAFILSLIVLDQSNAALSTFSDSRTLTASGTLKFTTTGCSISATTGGSTSGTYTSGTTGSCAAVITMNGSNGLIAPNGWACYASNRTTTANAQPNTASTTTTATITGTTVTGDVISFACTPY